MEADVYQKLCGKDIRLESTFATVMSPLAARPPEGEDKDENENANDKEKNKGLHIQWSYIGWVMCELEARS